MKYFSNRSSSGRSINGRESSLSPRCFQFTINKTFEGDVNRSRWNHKNKLNSVLSPLERAEEEREKSEIMLSSGGGNFDLGKNIVKQNSFSQFLYPNFSLSWQLRRSENIRKYNFRFMRLITITIFNNLWPAAAKQQHQHERAYPEPTTAKLKVFPW